MSGCTTCLVHHVDKGLCVVPREAVDHVICILTREDCLDQGGELMRSKRAVDQTSTGWGVKVEKNEKVSIPYSISKDEEKTHRSRIREPLRDLEDQGASGGGHIHLRRAFHRGVNSVR